MLPPERILLPIESSPLSLTFAESVLSLAMKWQARIVLLDTNQLAVHGRVCSTPVTRFWENAMHDARIDWKFDTTDALTLIMKSAGPRDLIMMPCLPGGMLNRWFGKRTVETVLGNCASAAWIGLDPKPINPLRRPKIACAVDLHEDSGRVALNAAFLSRTLNASLVLIHAIPHIDEGLVHLAAGDDLPTTLNEHVARRELAAMCPASQECGVPIIVRGDAPRAIRNALRKLSADLLVIGPGRQPLGQLELGSHVLDIVRAAPCPVLILDKEQPRVFEKIQLSPSFNLERKSREAEPAVA